ncbi:MAG TPA: glutathione peroxidase [Gemmataceae bacterium]|nr:glutathione peroxidase [Gemmataceae bacterium]
MSPLDFEMKSIDGKPFKFADLKGKVILVVNVASKCGNTPQYAGLEKLYEKYGKDGFVIVGVPANNFGGQEPGTNADIVKFCESTYKVKFPLLAKVSVKGPDITPLYTFLTSEKTGPVHAGPISWNFEKFLIGRDGSVVGRFAPRTPPADLDDPIQKALAK